MAKNDLALLMTGSELMSGDILESNSAVIAQEINNIGLIVKERVVIGDERTRLTETIERLTLSYDCLIINGGLGPTSDDLTAEILADINQSPLKKNSQALKHIQQWCSARGFEANQANLKQALLPEEAIIFPNAPGSAAAFHLNINNCLVIATPGVPSELMHILEHQLIAFLAHKMPQETQASWQYYTLMGIGESHLQQVINDSFSALHTFFDIGYRAALPCLEFKLKPKRLKDKQQQLEQQQHIIAYLQPFIIGNNHTTLAQSIVTLFQDKQLSLSFAESCTGGLMASEMTKIPGSSSIFYGGIVSYSNALKENLLQVSEKTLAQHGAVSEETVLEMLSGVLSNCASDYGIAVTGIAGPGGGAVDKPLGTVWIAWGSLEKKNSIGLCIPFERHAFQSYVTAVALDLLRRELLHIEDKSYLRRWLIKPIIENSSKSDLNG